MLELLLTRGRRKREEKKKEKRGRARERGGNKVEGVREGDNRRGRRKEER